jgi:hypothetical protein
MNKIQKPNNSKYYTAPSETFRFYTYIFRVCGWNGAQAYLNWIKNLKSVWSQRPYIKMSFSVTVSKVWRHHLHSNLLTWYTWEHNISCSPINTKSSSLQLTEINWRLTLRDMSVLKAPLKSYDWCKRQSVGLRKLCLPYILGSYIQYKCGTLCFTTNIRPDLILA